MKKKRLLKTVLSSLLIGGMILSPNEAKAQASYNFKYTEGATVSAGGNYFLYNIGSGMFLTDGMDYGTHASVDHAGRVITLAANNSGYSIYARPFSSNGSAEKAGYMTLNGYIDTGTNDADWVFTPVTVAGYTNAYTIKHSDTQYLYYEVKDNLYQSKMGAFVNVGNSTGDAASYWLLIPMSVRQAAKDYTYLLRNTDFHHPWELMMWSNTADWTNTAGGKKENACAEMYGKGFDISQTISATVDNGRYKLYNQAFYNNADNANQSYLYANSDQAAIAILNANNEGTAANMAGASDAFTAGQYVNSVETFVSNGSLKVGLKNATTAGNAWTIMDNFYLEYLGQVVMDYSSALPSTAMTADSWYYFDIAVAGDYQLTANALSDISYTTDAYHKLNASASTWNSATQALAPGRYYVKSTSSQTLAVAAASYTYTVGSATVDYEYVQGGETVTVTYADAITNSGEALAVSTSGVTFNGSTPAELTATANGFTFKVPSGLTAATSYTLAIPAGIIGYANGNTYNETQNITIKTPAVFDGTYYLKVAATTTDRTTNSTATGTVGKYLARGAAWGTHATVDNYGLPVTISTNKYNLSNIQVYDTKRYYYYDGSFDLWADKGDQTNVTNFVFGTNQGYLTISPASNTNVFFKHNDNEASNEVASVYFDGNGNNAGPIILWELVEAADHATAMASRKGAQAAAAATAAYSDDDDTYSSLSSVNTVAAMETAVAGMFSKVVVGGDAPTSVSEIYENKNNGSQTDAFPKSVYTGTITIPAAGLYRFSMQAFYRSANNATTQAMHTNNVDFPPVVLFLGDAETQIKSLYDEVGGATAYDGNNDAQFNGQYYANNTTAALKMFQEGKYKNDVWAYFDAAGEYSYGVKYIGFANNSAQWFIYSPEAVTVTYYGSDDSRFDKLNAEIAKAQAINAVWNNSDLADEISTAQAMYTAYSANLTAVNDEIDALKAKYPTSVAVNNGNFDTNPVLLADGTISSSASNGTSSYYINSNDNTTVYMYNTYGFSATTSTIKSNAAQGVTGEYGSTLQQNGTTPPAKDIYGETSGAALHISAGWNDSPVYTQDVNLSAGRYILYYEMQNRSTATTIAANYIGLDGKYSTKVDGFTANEWLRDIVTVDIYETGNYTLSVGMKGTGGSGNNAKLWIDNVEIYRVGDAASSIQTEDGIVTVLGENTLADINAALTNTIAVVNLEKASGLSNAAISTANNPNLLIYAKSGSQVSNTKNVIVDGSCSNLDLQKSSTSFIVPDGFTATNAKYTLASGELAGGNFATLMIPFAATLPSGGTAYALDQSVDLLEGNIRGTAVSSVAANTPVLVTKAGDYSSSNATIPVIAAGATNENGELVGTYTAGPAPEGSYVLQNHTSGQGVAFYLVGSKKPTVNPFRAYIKQQASNVKAISVHFGDADGIQALDNGQWTMDDAEIFNLAGQRLSNPQRGVNIINGKKVVVK